MSGLHVNLLSLCGTVFWTSRVWVCGQSKSTNMSRNVPRGGNSVFRFPSSVRIIFSDHFSASCGEPRFRQSLASAVRLRFSSAVFLASSLLSQRNFIFIFRLLAVSHVFVFNFSFRRFSSSFLLRLRFLDLDHFLLSKFPSVSILFWFSVCLMVWIGICLRARATFAAVKLLV